MSITGEKDGHPLKVGVALVDITTGTFLHGVSSFDSLVVGLYATTAILAALLSRYRTQKGQHIDVSLFNVSIAMLGYRGQDFLVDGKVIYSPMFLLFYFPSNQLLGPYEIWK